MPGNWHARFCRPAEGAIPSLSLTIRINRPGSGSGAGNGLSLLVMPSAFSLPMTLLSQHFRPRRHRFANARAIVKKWSRDFSSGRKCTNPARAA